MHPVHKLFGILTILATLAYLLFNFRSLTIYLRTKAVFVYGSVLVAVLVLVYGAAINDRVSAELAAQMDSAANLEQME